MSRIKQSSDACIKSQRLEIKKENISFKYKQNKTNVSPDQTILIVRDTSPAICVSVMDVNSLIIVEGEIWNFATMYFVF